MCHGPSLHETSEKPRTGATKVALLHSVARDEAFEVYNSFTEGESKNDFETVVKKFHAYCEAQLNEVHARFMFRQRVQANSESAEQSIRDLRRLARSCNFGTMSESMIRDPIVYGTSNGKVREKLLRDKGLTLVKAEQVCKSSELAAAQKEIRTQERHVDPVKAS